MRFTATCFSLLAVLTTPAAIAQQAADTIVTRGKILTVDTAFHTVEALADHQRPHRRHRHERANRALRGQEHEGHRRRRRHRHPGPHRQPLPLHARRRNLARAGPVRRRRLASRSAADPRRQGREPETRRLDHGARGLDAEAVRRRARWLHARGARRRRAEESAVRAGRLQHRLREQPRAQSGWAEPGGRRAPSRAGSRVVPTAVCAVRRDASGLARAARAEPHGLHARAQLDRPHGRVQPGAVGLPGGARGERAHCRSASGRR